MTFIRMILNMYMIGEFYAYILHKIYIMAKKVLAYDLISGQIRTCKVVRAIFKC